MATSGAEGVDQLIDYSVTAAVLVVCGTGGLVAGPATLGLGTALIWAACGLGSWLAKDQLREWVANNYGRLLDQGIPKSRTAFVEEIYRKGFKTAPDPAVLPDIVEKTKKFTSIKNIVSITLAYETSPAGIAAAKKAAEDEARAKAILEAKRRSDAIVAEQNALLAKNQRLMPLYIGLGVLAVGAVGFAVVKRASRRG